MRSGRAFTLVEILIVVVILGILAAIAVPQFTRATKDASAAATLDQLVKTRQALSIYYFRNYSQYPEVQEGVGGLPDRAWAQLCPNSDYLIEPPQNFWVDPTARTRIVYGTGPDATYQADRAWIFNPATGDLWAGGFDAEDKPIPH